MQALQTVFIGLSLGSILVLMSLGLVIIYGQIGVINMAHGEFMMIGAYTTFVVQNLCLGVLPPAYGDLFFAISFPLAFLAFGFLAFRSRIKGVYLAIITRALAGLGGCSTCRRPALSRRGG